MTVFERIFRYFKFELPSVGATRFEVTSETVANPQDALKRLIKEHSHNQRNVLADEIASFEQRFAEQTDLRISFTDEAKELLVDYAVDRDKTIRAVCEDRFKDLEHGLKIIARNLQQEEFEVTRAMAEDPDKELSRLVVESFKHRKDDDPEESPNA